MPKIGYKRNKKSGSYDHSFILSYKTLGVVGFKPSIFT